MAKKPFRINTKLIRITNLYDITAKQVYAYVQNLHRHIRRQTVIIRKLRKKLEVSKLQRLKAQEVVEVAEDAEQDANDDVLEALEKAERQEQAAKADEPLDVKAFVDDIKKTAQDFDYQNRYIYEPTSGLYYDPETGYYYNAIYGLHYDGQRGCYLKYNEQTKEYQFYSQVIPQETLEEQKPKPRQKKRKRTVERHHRLDSAEEQEENEEEILEDSRRTNRYRRHRRSRSRSRSRSPSRELRRKRRSRSKSYYSISSRSTGSEEDRRRKRKEKEKSKRKKAKRSKERRKSEEENKEEGELDSSSGSGSEGERKSVIVVESSSSDRDFPIPEPQGSFADMSRKYPPSLRLIVRETNLVPLKEGSLFIVTCKGGSLGREGDHDVIIPDINVSKYHLKFTYNEKNGIYQVIDLGSRNGTIFNGLRMAPTLQESEPFDIIHGTVIQLNQTKLLCHIHDGNATCGNCEPGLLVKGALGVEDERITKPVTHKEGLKLLQKRYGLEDEKYVEPVAANPLDYNDRAAYRRKTKGSSNEHAKTQTASVDQRIGSDNKGFKMLSKLGWSEGQTLGKNDEGLTEPIPLVTNVGTSGLGSQSLAEPTASLDDKKKMIWKLAQERYKACGEVEEKAVEEVKKPECASLKQQISSENKGFQMLAKLGWNEGQSLGKRDEGLKEPISLLSNVGTSGLGSKPLKKPGEGSHSGKKKTIWKKKQGKCKTSKLFEESESE